MFLFRKTAEPNEEAGEHEPINVTNAAHEAEEEVEDDAHAVVDAYAHDDCDDDDNGEDEVDDEEEAGAAAEEEEPYAPEEEADYEGEGGVEAEAPHETREGTVPPLEERHIVTEHQREVDAAGAAEAHAAVPSHAAAVPGLAMPRTYAAAMTGTAGGAPPANPNAQAGTGSNSYTPHTNINLHNNNNSASGTNVRRSSRGTTPRATGGLSPRSHSRGGGHSYAGSALSAEEVQVVEQQYRRASSVVLSARNLTERRASSVNHLIGPIDGGVGAARRRSGSMTAAEREAVERMVENDFHRQEAAERSAQFGRIRETTLVETELAKEKASYELLLAKEKERRDEIGRRSSLREERMATAAQRRQEMEQKRQQAVLSSVNAKDMRYTLRDPYTVVAAQRRYRSPIAPSRRVSSPAINGDSRRASGAAAGPLNGHGSRTHSASADHRRHSASEAETRQVKPGIDMSRPQHCLPLNAWKTPAQLQRKEQAGTYSPRCLPPGAWQAPTLADHPRQWH